MKQVVQNYKSGDLALLEVPEPACKPGGVLVRTRYSLISTGTELMKVSEASKSMLGKARARPDQVAKVMQSVRTNGLAATYRKATDRLDSYTPLGYSLCGVVEQVGDGLGESVAVGDLVACAGNEHALHAELNWVPRNLFTPVPRGLDPAHAAFGTVGAIALQGLRQGQPQLGESALVIGLGLIGQLVVQLLGANGVRVIGVDPDPRRCRLAERFGAAACADPASGAAETAVAELTDGHGVDQVYLVAGGSSNEPVELAARAARDRGRVVDIGKCRLDLPWNAYFDKELDVRFSRSYGPGRYDPGYELDGHDYPIGYVRWTERRNLACFLDLLAAGRVDVAPLISQVAEFSSAVETYRELAGARDAVAVLFDYPAPDVSTPNGHGNGAGTEHGAVRTNGLRAAAQRPVGRPKPAEREPAERPEPAGDRPAPGAGKPLRVAFAGAGNYASSMLLPHLRGRADVTLGPVVTTTALSGTNAQRKFGFAAVSTDLDAVLGDPAVDAVFVVTRHSSHAELAARALRAGKAVFVEKPLALSSAELDAVSTAVTESGNDRLQVGFNRRFAPLLLAAAERFGGRSGPASVRYLVNAGRLEAGSWYARQDTEGSRFAGEGGHFIDTVSFLLDAAPESVYARATAGHGDPSGQSDLHVLLDYPDGSLAAITYATSGAGGFGKEFLELLADGKVLHLDDFRRASVHARTRWSRPRVPRGRDKGQRGELEAFLSAVASGAPMPIPLASLRATTAATLAVETSLATGTAVPLAGELLAGEPARTLA